MSSKEVELATKTDDKLAETNTAGDNAGTAQKTEKKGDDHQPDTFDNPVQYWLSCLGFAVGFGNVWRFPYLCYKSGGAVFLIPYLISLVAIAIPLYMLETAYGQLIKCKLQQRFSIISPALWATSFCQIAVSWLTTIYYITLMAWSFSFFFDSFKNPLPWVENSAEEGKELTKAQSAENLWNPDYFHKDVLKRSDAIEETGGMVWWLAFMMFLSYLVTYFAAFKGLKSIGKIVYVTVLLPYVILSIFLIKGLTLEGCGEGLKYLFKPDITKLWDINVWIDAAIQIQFSSGVAFGPLMYYGTARKDHEKILRASYMVPIMNSATSLYAALGVFSFVGHVSHILDIPIEKVSTSGLDLAFVAYPGMLNLLAGSNFWSLLFFMMLLTLGIDSVFGFFDHILQYFLDTFPQIEQKMRREVYVGIFTLFSFLCSLIFCLESGYYSFGTFDSYAAGIALLTCLLVELILIPWVFGMDKLNVLLNRRTGETIPKFVIVFVKYIIPVYIVIIYILSFVDEFSKDGDDERKEPYGFLWLARLLFIVPMLTILVGYFKRIETANVYDLIESQYGIKFDDKGQATNIDGTPVQMNDTAP